MDDLRVLIADDDPGMRLVLRKILSKVEGFTLIGEAQDGKAALEMADTLRPDILFLDVGMPEMTGIECARVMQDMNPATIIIFATAHDTYMGDAFEVYAFDYMVKPFKVERVVQTLERARAVLSRRTPPEENKKVPAAAPVIKGRMMLHHRGGISFVNLNDVLLVQREDRTTVIYTADGGRYVTSDSLSDMEQRLPQDAFFRCHKSYIINLNHIKDISPYGRWTYVVRLEGIKQDALITHEKYDELENMFR